MRQSPNSTPQASLTALLATRFSQAICSPVIAFQPGVTRLVRMNLSARNPDFSREIYTDINRFCTYIDDVIREASADYGIGGYAEDREMYARSPVFDGAGEPRRLHLGLDVWAPVQTPVFAPLDGVVHSVGIHTEEGNYGGTLILQHQVEGHIFHTLFGHLALSVRSWSAGQQVHAGQLLASLGRPEENGCWPPHLHFQLIHDIEGFEGDYPGVCRKSEAERFLSNCPDPSPLLGFGPIQGAW